MKAKFVSDVSGILLNYYDNKEFEKIQHVIQDEITRISKSDNYDSAYRLQQDIAFLNTSLLTTISKYVNTNVSSTSSNAETKNGVHQDTFKAQNRYSKIKLTYKYYYLFVKMIAIIVILSMVYLYFFRSDNERSSFPFFNYGNRFNLQ